MNRRDFIAAGAAAAMTGALLASAQAQQGTTSTETASAPAPSQAKFKLKYAPHFDQFKELAGPDPIDQLKFIADQGFSALEDNGMMGRPVEQQEAIAREMSRLGLTMGVFTAMADFGAPTFQYNDGEKRQELVKQMKAALEVAKRVNAKWCTIVPGQFEPKLDFDLQTANVIDNLKACAEVCEPAGVIIVIEPLNHRDHPGMFLQKIAQAYQICRAVNSPSCKILNDLYHQQITEGDLILRMDAAWSEIGYFHLGDNPGRKEPGSGEVNFHNIFKHIHEKGYTGVLGMEHGSSRPGKDGEQAVIAAYRACDEF